MLAREHVAVCLCALETCTFHIQAGVVVNLKSEAAELDFCRAAQSPSQLQAN